MVPVDLSSRFLAPAPIEEPPRPRECLAYLRVMFAVDDVDETVARLRTCGAELVGEVVQYRDVIAGFAHPGTRLTTDRTRAATEVIAFAPGYQAFARNGTPIRSACGAAIQLLNATARAAHGP